MFVPKKPFQRFWQPLKLKRVLPADLEHGLLLQAFARVAILQLVSPLSVAQASRSGPSTS